MGKKDHYFFVWGSGVGCSGISPFPRGTANLWSSSTQKRENFFSPLFLVSLFGKKRRSGQLRKVLWFLLPFPLGNEEEERKSCCRRRSFVVVEQPTEAVARRKEERFFFSALREMSEICIPPETPSQQLVGFPPPPPFSTTSVRRRKRVFPPKRFPGREREKSPDFRKTSAR